MILAGLALLLAVPKPETNVSVPSAGAFTQLTLPAGTQVRFKTVDPLDSRTANQGQRFNLVVVEDVMIGSRLLIPRGTPAVGEVEAVSGKGMVGKAGRLVVRPLFIDVAGKRVNLTGTSGEEGKHSTGGVAVASVLTSGLTLFITGKSASVPAGSDMLGFVRTDISLPQTVPVDPSKP